MFLEVRLRKRSFLVRLFMVLVRLVAGCFNLLVACENTDQAYQEIYENRNSQRSPYTQKIDNPEAAQEGAKSRADGVQTV